MEAPIDATYLGTRCCGADYRTPHWKGCTQRLDITDPASYWSESAKDEHDETHGIGFDERPKDCPWCLLEAEAQASR